MRVPILQLKEEYKEYTTRPKISNPQDIYNILKPLMPPDKEAFMLISLKTNNGIIAIRTISIGCLNANIVHPREVFRAAIFDDANSIIVAHNHPSGDTIPSREDIEITKKLAEAGNILGIKLLDHIIIGENHFHSFQEGGFL